MKSVNRILFNDDSLLCMLYKQLHKLLLIPNLLLSRN